MGVCPMCFSTITNDHPALLADKIDDAVNWYGFDRADRGVGSRFTVAGIGEAEVMAVKASYDSGEVDRGGYYGGELPQGTEFETFVVLRIGEAFFKKTGHGDSYGEVTWNGPVRPVKATTKTVTVYDFK